MLVAQRLQRICNFDGRGKSASHDANEKPAIDPALLEWCESHGMSFGPIAAGFVPNGWRGVIATADIEPDSCILRVPRALLLSCETAHRDARLAAAATDLPPLALLAVHLLYEVSKGSQSFWAPYLASMPPAYTTAACLTPADIEALQVPYAQRQASNAAEEAVELYKQAFPVLKSLDIPLKFTGKAAWRWALGTLSSRTMHLPGPNQAGCLTPFGDLHNYEPPPPPFTPRLDLEGAEEKETACGLDSGDGALHAESDEYRIYARRKYQKGDEVFLCYGRHTNLGLLEHYGFVLEDNPHDVAVLPTSALPGPVVTQLESMGAEPVIHANGNPSWELLRALRLAGLSSEERASAGWAPLEDRSAGPVSESWAMKTLIQACQSALDQLSTTLEEDEAVLREEGLSEGLRVAVAWRAGYKRILRRAMEICAGVSKRIDGEKPGAAVPSVLNIRQPKFLSSRRPAVPPPAGR